MLKYLLGYYNGLGIAQKLKFLGVSTVLVAGTVSVTLILLFKYYNEKGIIVTEAETFGKILAENIAPSIAARDYDKISNTLSSVEHNSKINQTFAVDSQWNVIGAFHKGSDFYRKRELLEKVKSRQSLWEAGSYFAVVSIGPQEQELGHLVIVASLDEFYIRGMQEMMVVFVIILIALGITFRFRAKLKESILLPISKLDESTNAIIRTGKLDKEVPIFNDDEIGGLAKNFNKMLQNLNNYHNEIEEQKSILAHQAHHDSLTHLPNRVLFNDRLVHAIAKAKRNGLQFALLFIDLDRFKQINDSFGHELGDKVLQALAARLQEVIRAEDTLARHGGDEFTVIIEDLYHAQGATVMAQKIIDALEMPVCIEDHELFMSCSIGISLYPQDGNEPNILVRNADTAMYKAKEEGRNTYHFYTNEMTELAYERVLLETALRYALEQKEFSVFYQPQVDALSGRIIGMEALVRWEHPERGLLSPALFVALAEETGLIVQMDRQVMRTAMYQVVRWHAQGLNPGRLALNLTMQQLQQSDFIELIKSLLQESGCRPEWLELEVTEGGIMKDPERAIGILQEISDLGIRLAIDDFGTGYSSLAYLKRLPVQKLKIDQSFVQDLPGNVDDGAIIDAVIALSKSMNLDVIAEGVETNEQKECLLEKKCMAIQGFLYARPLPADEMTVLLKKEML